MQTIEPLTPNQPADFGVNTWQALIELRRLGAIGEFAIFLHTVRADNEAKAREYILDDAAAYGYEPRNIVQLQRIK